MQTFHLKPILITDLEALYKRITVDFPLGEYPPIEAMQSQFRSGAHKGFFLISDSNEEVSYAICSVSESTGYVLLSLLAVDVKHRSVGIGERTVLELCDLYKTMHGIIVEVEIPERAKTEDDLLIRQKRIAFYESLGFELIPGITYAIWDIPMYLMAKPLSEPVPNFQQNVCEIMHTIYLNLMGNRFIHKLVCGVEVTD